MSAGQHTDAAGWREWVRRRFTGWEKSLVLIFVLSLPFVNPWVRGDGVGYYAFARALLVGHNLDFQKDWRAANPTFRMQRVDAAGRILPSEYTATGHLNNHFSIGPAILWSPFLLAAHAGVLIANGMGARVAASGYSRPYLWAMALGTALCGFLAIWISFRLARKYVSEDWAFLGSAGIWFASSLPVYMYFNPSWSHADSAFTVALFVWYWERTRARRAWKQWLVLGAIGGLMMDVYYLTAVLLLLPALESAEACWRKLRLRDRSGLVAEFAKGALFLASALAAFLPTLITKKLIYGSALSLGYEHLWDWKSPAFFGVLFSADHGLISWTPIVALAIGGLVALRRKDAKLGGCLLAVLGVYVYALGCYQDWAGISSFGNRFFVSLSIVFVLGLAALFEWFASAWTARKARVAAWAGTALLAAWNFGLIFQWGMHMIPVRGPVSWRAVAYNDVAVAPVRAGEALKSYMTRRKQLMARIERQDAAEIEKKQARDPE